MSSIIHCSKNHVCDLQSERDQAKRSFKLGDRDSARDSKCLNHPGIFHRTQEQLKREVRCNRDLGIVTDLAGSGSLTIKSGQPCYQKIHVVKFLLNPKGILSLVKVWNGQNARLKSPGISPLRYLRLYMVTRKRHYALTKETTDFTKNATRLAIFHTLTCYTATNLFQYE